MEDAKAEEMAMPLGKSRILPDWMIGAGKRVGVGQKTKQKKAAAVTAAPAKAAAKAVAPKSAAKTKAKR